MAEGGFQELVAVLRAAAEPTRLRILSLCEHDELTVSDLVRILDQSQPSVSQHLKSLATVGLIERVPEGTSVFCRMVRGTTNAAISDAVLRLIPPDDPVMKLDRIRLGELKETRTRSAAEYFAENAENWARLRGFHVDETKVEAALLQLLSTRKIKRLLDMGTGTGRMLEILSPYVGAAEGIDQSREMLSIARAALDAANLRNCRVRQGDIFALPYGNHSFDAVMIHQVLHFTATPAAAVAEAARVLDRQGILTIVDFAPHSLEELRSVHKHRRLGFTSSEVDHWCRDAGLEIDRCVELPGDPLTVVVWVAKPRFPVDRRFLSTHSLKIGDLPLR